MKFILTITLAAVLTLSGCASDKDYKAYADSNTAVATARANAETARYTALSKIAETGTESSKIAAVMALALGNNTTSANIQSIQAPQSSQALQWAQVLVPSITNIAGLHYASKNALAAADAATRVSESTNAAFVGISSKIQAPVTVVPTVTQPQANVTTTTTTSSTTDNHSTSSADVATTTLSGTGVLGAGSYTTTATTTPAPVVVTPVVTPPVIITPITTPAPVITPVIQVVPIAQP